MYSVMLKDGFSNARANARQRIENTLDLNRLFRAIDADPTIVGAGVVYIDNQFNVVTLRDFQPICSVTVKRVILREAPTHMAPQQFAQELESNPRESKVVFEAVGMALSCVGAFIAWSVVGASTVMSPFSGGASLVVAYIGRAAAIATTAQCFVGAARTGVELTQPSLNDTLDNTSWYQSVSMVLDAVSLMGVATTGLATVRLVQIVKTSTGKSLREVLKGLTRQERVKLTNELLTIRDPRLSPQLLKLRKMTGELPKRYTPQQLKDSTVLQIKDSFGAALGFAGSMMSGNIRALAVGVYSELADE